MMYRNTIWTQYNRSIEMHRQEQGLTDWTILNMWPDGGGDFIIVWQKAETRTRIAFVPPTLSEVQAYIDEKGYKVIAADFINHYAERDWENRNGKPVKNWKQTLRDVWASGVKEAPKPKEDLLKPKY